ncbi:PREDICTED: astacin-like metalloendopeptidase [Nanorana parkeri]|uniref:astacin-like metalloendopeptidase n=1 Tax=Nanorana parkeri TaxID=125878 RepID=UPI00085486AE|nr:PREDICTED: astacin-like metalloendopeptidase [Nanorana parkeri]
MDASIYITIISFLLPNLLPLQISLATDSQDGPIHTCEWGQSLESREFLCETHTIFCEREALHNTKTAATSHSSLQAIRMHLPYEGDSKRLIHHGDIAVKVSRSALTCPGQSCFWPKSSSGIVTIPYTLSAEYNSKRLIHHGDIAVKVSRSALTCPGQSCFWPKSSSGIVTIPYTLSAEYTSSDSAIIYSAIQEYTLLTCIRFVERMTEADYIQIRSVDGCWSYLGRIGGPQDLSLFNPGCLLKGIVQHELNHVLGFVHEHTRSDRDTYVGIEWAHISDVYKSNFEMTQPPTNNLGLPYDYASVMHYGRYAFSKAPGKATIVPKPDARVFIGQRYGLSSLDLQKINRLYQCDVCSSLLCDLSGSLHSGYISSVNQNRSQCVWLIRVPANKVFLQFHTFDTSPSCSSDSVKVYDGATKTSPLLINTTCRMKDLPPVLSSGNLMSVEFLSGGVTTFTASYQTVACGGMQMKETGTVTSLGYPTKYLPFQDCIWSIVAPTGHRIQLNFVSFTLESSRNCIYDYLSISDSSRSGTSVSDRYCGAKKMPSLVSSGNWMLLQFHSDKSVQSTGFQVTYRWATQRGRQTSAGLLAYSHTHHSLPQYSPPEIGPRLTNPGTLRASVARIKPPRTAGRPNRKYSPRACHPQGI